MAANPTVPEINATDPNARRLAELAALVDAVKDRVRAQYPESTSNGSAGSAGVISVGLPDLTPLARARDAAAGKMAAIGTVNPRAGGLVNNSIQSVKRAVARALNWFVRDQVIFNRQMITIVEICIETLADVNRTIHNLAGQTNSQFQQVRAETEPLRTEASALRTKTSELQDLGSHWHRWREEWQLKLHENEVAFLKSVADLNTVFHQKIGYVEAAANHRAAHSDSVLQQRVTDLQTSVERRVEALHADHENRLAGYDLSAGERQLAFEKQVGLLAAAFEKTATELDASYQQTAKELEAACQQISERRVAQLETAFTAQTAQFDARCKQIEHDTAASLRDQHDAFEQLANSNAGAIQRSAAEQIQALDQRLVKQALDFQQSLATSVTDLQKKFYGDLDRIRTEYELVIHAELRVVRQRLAAGATVPAVTSPVTAPSALPFDYARFADRFRGPEPYVTEAQRFYVSYFAGRRHVLDIGCGRGEFLKLMRESGIPARGIESSGESAEYCRSLGLDAVHADLFTYLSEQPDATLDGIFCSQVVEHLPPDRLPEFVRLCATRLATGGVLAIETPNPECLAIFATHFYLDPTHTRPVPPQLLAFYMEEFGLGRIEVHRRAPAVESIPEVGELPEAFRTRFFDGLDYAIMAYKL